jgi:hypothetical protein
MTSETKTEGAAILPPVVTPGMLRHWADSLESDAGGKKTVLGETLRHLAAVIPQAERELETARRRKVAPVSVTIFAPGIPPEELIKVTVQAIREAYGLTVAPAPAEGQGAA